MKKIFLKEERKALLKTPKVGEATIKRFEMLGIYSLKDLSTQKADDIAYQLSIELEKPRLAKCGLAKTAIENAINTAKMVQ